MRQSGVYWNALIESCILLEVEGMTLAERIKENDKRIEERINREIDSCEMAYKIKDREGNQFVFAGIENGFPVYRGIDNMK